MCAGIAKHKYMRVHIWWQTKKISMQNRNTSLNLIGIKLSFHDETSGLKCKTYLLPPHLSRTPCHQVRTAKTWIYPEMYLLLSLFRWKCFERDEWGWTMEEKLRAQLYRLNNNHSYRLNPKNWKTFINKTVFTPKFIIAVQKTNMQLECMQGYIN